MLEALPSHGVLGVGCGGYPHPPQYTIPTIHLSTIHTHSAPALHSLGWRTGWRRGSLERQEARACEAGSARLCLLAQFFCRPNSSLLSVTQLLSFFLLNRPWPSLALLVACSSRSPPPYCSFHLAIGDTVSCYARNADGDAYGNSYVKLTVCMSRRARPCLYG